MTSKRDMRTSSSEGVITGPKLAFLNHYSMGEASVNQEMHIYSQQRSTWNGISVMNYSSSLTIHAEIEDINGVVIKYVGKTYLENLVLPISNFS